MQKIQIKGISFDAPEQTAAAVQAAMGEDKTRLDSVTSELERMKARVDTLVAELDKEKKLRTDASDPAKIAAAVAGRVALERSATKVLAGTAKKAKLSDQERETALRLDGLTDREIQERVILSVHKDAVLKDRSADYVTARFDSVVESYAPDEERKDGLDQSRRHIDPPRDDKKERERNDAGDQNGAVRTDADFRKKLNSAWRAA
jgi:DNA-binding CsgD family transcriptional regulator